MKTILCYGDSNTWGWDAVTMGRHPRYVRWPGVLQQVLGDGYYVIEEGLNGRTTVWDDPIEGYKNGKEYLIPCLETHKPLDLVVLMLGSNDLKMRFSVTAFDIASGAGVLVDIIQRSQTGRDDNAPPVLLIAPPPIGDLHPDFAEMFQGAAPKAAKFPEHYKRVAEEFGCAFLDSAEIVVPSPHDGLHLDASEHQKLGEAVAAQVQAIVSA
jgi:lysophospholipase L1-like esterase